jgi:aspartate/methionine/tyrosine aminotransferase
LKEAFDPDVVSSCRARQAVELLPTYLSDARSIPKYSSDNPSGALQLSVAESKILEDWLVPALLEPIQNNRVSELIYYQATAGREDCKSVLCEYLESLVGLPSETLDSNGLVVGAGCNAVLENLCFCLAQQGDAVLIPTPYYAAFEFDLQARVGLVVEPVNTQAYHPSVRDSIDPALYYPNTQALDAAYTRSENAGHRPKILLISHPHNPLGICYPAPVLEEIFAWCRSRNLHLISDEIYAGSVYGEPAFGSVLKAARGSAGLGPYVHWVYALSKDFGLSGMRVGVAYSENEEIRLPMQKLNDLCQVSSSTQRWVTELFQRKNDTGELWPLSFLHENRDRLGARSRQLTKCLDDCSIPYLPPTSGLFVWIDLTAYLSADSGLTDSQKEHKLYRTLAKDFGLLLTPGLSMRNEKPGFFRIVFTAATDEEFTLCLERFREFARYGQVEQV